MSLSTVSVDTYLRDYGTTVGVRHRDPQPDHVPGGKRRAGLRRGHGLLVLGSRCPITKAPTQPTDPNVQQAMVNMFADMGIQPTTLDASLILATQSTDTTKPTATITSPTVGASFVEGQKVTITGTAQDFGGGIIAGVEISTDGGQSWWKATGRENWSYSWIVQASGTYTIMARAVDDSLNLGTPSAGAQVTVSLPSTSSLWTLAQQARQTETTLDRDGVELGVRFQSSTGGFVNGIRFYKGFYNIGDARRRSVDFDRHAAGHRRLRGREPLGLADSEFLVSGAYRSGTTYVASYHTDGYYSANDNYFTSTYTNGLLKVLPGGGVYAYSCQSRAISDQRSEQHELLGRCRLRRPIPTRRRRQANDFGLLDRQERNARDLVRRAVGQRH